jgi:hypothetical protein
LKVVATPVRVLELKIVILRVLGQILVAIIYRLVFMFQKVLDLRDLMVFLGIGFSDFIPFVDLLHLLIFFVVIYNLIGFMWAEFLENVVLGVDWWRLNFGNLWREVYVFFQVSVAPPIGATAAIAAF